MLLVLSSLFRARASVLQIAKIRKESSISSAMSQLLPRLYHLQLCGATFCLSTLINNPGFNLCFYYSISFFAVCNVLQILSLKCVTRHSRLSLPIWSSTRRQVSSAVLALLTELSCMPSTPCHHPPPSGRDMLYWDMIFPFLCVSKDSSGWKWCHVPTLSLIPRRRTDHTLPSSVISMAPPAFVSLFKWPTESSEDILLC